MKIVVFDLDETLGYFTQYGIFWDCLSSYLKITNKYQLTQSEFDETLDLFSFFLRPNIINILNYLKHKKKTKCCYKMMIYTNNTGSRDWINSIINYFEKKINYKLVDQIISAFKINGKRVEICRTTQNKTYKDFIKCTKIPSDAEICFMDDSFYPEMAKNNIYYINVKPYYYNYTFENMLLIFEQSNIGKKIIQNDKNFSEIMLNKLNSFDYLVLEKEEKEYEIDIILGKHIISHLQNFFKRSIKNISVKNKRSRKNRTLKQY